MSLTKCERCGQSLIDEELTAHRCNPPTMRYESEDMVFYNLSEDESGNPLLIVKTVVGTLYAFTGIEKPSPSPQAITRCATCGERHPSNQQCQ